MNAVSTEYLLWRSEIAGEQVQRAVTALRQRIGQERAGSARRQELEDRLSELEVLASVPSPNAVLVQRATATKTSPAPVRDTLLGAMIGLMLALLLVGIREALDTKIRSEEDIEELLDTRSSPPSRASAPVQDGDVRTKRRALRRLLRAWRQTSSRATARDGRASSR